jgi:hypothetical protein
MCKDAHDDLAEKVSHAKSETSMTIRDKLLELVYLTRKIDGYDTLFECIDEIVEDIKTIDAEQQQELARERTKTNKLKKEKNLWRNSCLASCKRAKTLKGLFDVLQQLLKDACETIVYGNDDKPTIQ